MLNQFDSKFALKNHGSLFTKKTELNEQHLLTTPQWFVHIYQVCQNLGTPWHLSQRKVAATIMVPCHQLSHACPRMGGMVGDKNLLGSSTAVELVVSCFNPWKKIDSFEDLKKK